MQVELQLGGAGDRSVLLVEIERVGPIQIRDDRRALHQLADGRLVASSLVGHDDQAAALGRHLADLLEESVVLEQLQNERLPAIGVLSVHLLGVLIREQNALNVALAVHHFGLHLIVTEEVQREIR